MIVKDDEHDKLYRADYLNIGTWMNFDYSMRKIVYLGTKTDVGVPASLDVYNSQLFYLQKCDPIINLHSVLVITQCCKAGE